MDIQSLQVKGLQAVFWEVDNDALSPNYESTRACLIIDQEPETICGPG